MGIVSYSTLYREKKLITLYFQIQVNIFFISNNCSWHRIQTSLIHKPLKDLMLLIGTKIQSSIILALCISQDMWLLEVAVVWERMLWSALNVCDFHSEVQHKTKEHWNLNQWLFPLWQQLYSFNSSPSVGISLGCQDALPVVQKPQTHCLLH